jgi:hypothetical protein
MSHDRAHAKTRFDEIALIGSRPPITGSHAAPRSRHSRS